MLQIEVMLEVPLRIAAGLAGGQLERVGGVVRDVGTKQIVALLREGGQLANGSHPASGVLKALLDTSTGGLAGAVIGAGQAAVTAHSHYLIMQQMARLETLLSISTGIGVLNLATSVTSYALLSYRLGVLEQKIEGLYGYISEEFQKNRQAKLRAAILAAENAFGMEKPDSKKRQAHNAIDRFDEVRQFILQDIEDLFKSSPSIDRTVRALVHAIDMDSLLIRCHLELDELRSARNHLQKYLNKYEPQVNELVSRCLGDHRASFFHSSVSKADLYRFITIEDWLHRNDEKWTSNDTDDVCMKALDSYRNEFWDMNAIAGLKPGGPFSALPFTGDAAQMPTQLERIILAELLIEKYEGFRGFNAELEGIARLKISYSEWEKQQEEALVEAARNLADFTNLTEHEDYVILVDKEWLAEQTDSTAA